MSPRLRLILIAGIASALLGGTAAWALSQAKQSRREQSTANLSMPANHLRFEPSPSEYMQIAMSLVVLIKQVAGLFRPG